MTKDAPSYFHLHLVSDSTGETLTTIARAAAVQYPQMRAVEHVHPLVRTERQLHRALQEIEASPGIVLYTIVNTELADLLEQSCKALNARCVAVLDPVMEVFKAYLGAPTKLRVGGQHILDAAYFRRIDALNFTMAHDDGALPEDLDEADIIVLGISRTSKTPTSIYLANRGYKTANLPLVPGIPVPDRLFQPSTATIVGLVATADRISQIRRNRVIALADRNLDTYVDKSLIAEEITYSRRLCAQNDWPVIDVTRRSIEETAAAIIKIHTDLNPPSETDADWQGGM